MIKNCKLVYVDGVVMAFDSKGNKSQLFLDALEYSDGVQEDAVQIWGATQTEEFLEEVGDIDNPSLDVVLRFLNNRTPEPKSLKKGELKQVSLMMSDLGITDINTFAEYVNDMFQPNGYYAVDTEKMLNSGMYSLDDISTMNHQKVKGFIERLNHFNMHKDFNLEVGAKEAKIKLRNTTAKKTPLGNYPLVSEQELIEYIAQNADNTFSKESVDEVIANSLFPHILDDKKAMRYIYGAFKNKRKVPKMYLYGNVFVSQDVSTFSTIKNTLLANVDPIELEADIEWLETISDTVWNKKQKEIKSVLKDIEKVAIKYNVDIIGISDISNNKPLVLSTLSALDDMLLIPSVENIQKFATKKDEAIGMVDGSGLHLVVENIPIEYNIVKIDTDMTDDVMFQKGFLRISENGLYHRIQRASREEMYELLYDRVVNNELVISSTILNPEINVSDVQNKELIIKAIESFVNSRETGIESPLNEEISLLQTIFKHTPLTKQSPQETETEDVEYLKTGFISDFYNYILREKQEKSDLYNKVLKNFEVTDADIVLNSLETPDITGIEYETELRDYARLKKFGSIKKLHKSLPIREDLNVINNPQTIREEQTDAVVKGEDGYLVSQLNPNTYIKVNNTLYRKLFDKANGSLYKEITSNSSNDTLYFDNNLNFSYNREEAETAYKKLFENLSPRQHKSAEEISKQANIPTTFTPIQYQIIGEKGASRMIEYKQQLDRAKELEKEGKTPAQIEIETGWYKYKGDWRTIPKEVVESFQIKDNTVNKELTLKQVLGDENTLFNFYPEIGETKVIFLGETYEGISVGGDIKQSLGAFNEKENIIYINTFFQVDNSGRRSRATETHIRKVLEQAIKNLIQESAQKNSKETVDEVINKLKQTGLSSEVFQLNTTQLQEKLKELGVSDDIAMQVSMQIKNGYYSNAQTAFTNLKDKNVKNTQGWLKALTDVQKNGGVKNVSQELEWIGLEDFLNEYVKENNPKNGNIPAFVVEEYILLNQIEIVDVSKEGFRLKEHGILEDETYNNINEELSRLGIEDKEGLLNQWYYAEESKNQKWENLTTFLESNNIDLEYLIEKTKTDSLTPDETKYSAYQLKGGENYREVLLTMPNSALSKYKEALTEKYGKGYKGSQLTEEEIDKLQDLKQQESSNYESNHWSEKNILAHVRLNEKTLPDGRKVLIVNEIQADISQDLKKEQDKILDKVNKEFDNFLDNLIRNNVIIKEC